MSKGMEREIMDRISEISFLSTEMIDVEKMSVSDLTKILENLSAACEVFRRYV